MLSLDSYNYITVGSDVFMECNKCKITKPLNNFYFNNNIKNHALFCIDCYKSRRKDFYINNKAKIAIYTKEHRLRNAEVIKEKKRLYNINNAKNKAEYDRVYRLNNQAIIKLRKHNYKKDRLLNDIEFKILHRMRTRIYNALKSKFNIKSKRTLELIGCDKSTLKHHIEKQFKNGMNWNNYGLHGWHVDHIIPCASFDLTTSQEQEKCFHYTNLQPLWWYENLEKSDKVENTH